MIVWWRAICALTLALLVTSLPAAAQRSARPPVIGFLGVDSEMQAWLSELRGGLRALGYEEGRNIAFALRWAEGRFDRLPELAAELAALNVNAIVTAGPQAVRAAQRATATIPIVFVAHDPVGLGFVHSLARPGGNSTGVAFQDAELSTKRLDLLRETVPQLTRVAVLWHQEGGGTSSVQAVEASARTLGLQLLVLEIRAQRDFPAAIASAKSWGAQGLVQLASPFIAQHRAILLDLLSTNRLAATCEMRRFVAEGCLMTYSASLKALFRRTAYFVDRILKGARPADLPVEQPREFELVVNLKTAKALGLTIPPSVLGRADEIIHQ